MADPAVTDSSAPSAPGWMMKDSKGNSSVTTTFAVVSFVVTTLAYISSIVTHIGPVEFRSFDVAACSSYMGPIMALYFGRRWTEAKSSDASASPAQGS